MKKNRAHRFKVFALAFGVSLVVLSIIFIPIMLRISPLRDYSDYFGNSSGKGSGEVKSVYTPASADSLTLLAIVTDGGKARYFLLLRLDALNKRILVSSLPYNMRVITTERTDTLAGYDAYGGTLQVKNILELLFKVTIDRTARMTSTNFIKSINTLGTVKYNLPYSLIHKDTSSNNYINIPKGAQTLDGRTIYDMFRFPSYREGEEHRYKVQSDVLTKLLNQSLTPWLNEHGESVFNTLVNLTETDLSYADYQQRRALLRSLIEETEEPALPIFVSGQFTDSFSITQKSVDTIAMYFKSDPPEQEEGSRDETSGE